MADSSRAGLTPRRRTVALSLGVAAVVALAAGCGSSAPSAKASSSGGGKTLKIGELDSLTGAAQVYGVPQHNGIALAIDQINAKGGLDVGGTKYKLSLTAADDKTDAANGVAQIQKLISQDGIHYIIGTLSSEVASAYVPVIKNRNDVIDVVVGAAVAGITDNKPVYRPRVTSDQYTPQLVAYLKTLSQQSPITKVAVVYDQTHAGVVQQLPTLKQDLKDANFDLVANPSFKLGAASLDSQIAAVTRSGAQAVIFQGYAPDAANFIKQSRAQGFTGPILTNVGFTPKDLQKAAVPDSAMKDAYDIGAPFPADLITLGTDADNAKAFADAYQAKFGQAPGFTSASAYDGVFILAKAIQNAGSVTNYDGVRQALDALKVSDVDNLAEEITPQDGGLLFKNHQAYFKSVVHVWNGTAFVPKQLVG